ncbi:hypothetical protein HPB47_022709, partial [Ixodes persulcatus]
ANICPDLWKLDEVQRRSCPDRAVKMVFLPIATILLVMLCLYTLRRKRFSLFKKLGIPGPPPSLISGNLTQINQRGPIAMFEEWTNQYGNIVGFYNGGTPVLIANDLDLIKKIQVEDFHNFQERGVASVYIRTHQLSSMSLSNSSGARWKSTRRMLTQAFTPSKLRKLRTVMVQCCDAFMENMERLEAEGNGFEIGGVFRNLSMNITVRCFFGDEAYKALSQEGTGMAVIKQQLGFFVDSLRNGWQTRLIGYFPEYYLLWRWLLILRAKFSKLPMDKIRDVMAKIVKQRRSAPKNGQEDLLQLMLNETAKGGDMASGRTRLLSDNEIQGNIFFALIDGFETVCTAMSFMAYLLAKHQDVQDRLRTEITASLGEDGELNLDNIMQIEYMNQVILETLRCYPPLASFITRTCGSDYDYNGLKIPSGITVMVPVHRLHRDINLWNNPEAFDPDRFSADNKGSLHPVQFQPFGNGPRKCIGMRFVQQELKITFAKLLSKYKLCLDDRHLK